MSVQGQAVAPRRGVLEWVPLGAFVLTLAIQFVAAVMWAGATAQRISEVEKDVAALADIDLRLARLEERGEAAASSLERIERRLDSRGYP